MSLKRSSASTGIDRRSVLRCLPGLILLAAGAPFGSACAHSRGEIVVHLLNGKNLDAFYSYLRDSGKNSDPHGVFKIQDGLLRISGEEWGYLATRKEYANFRLVAEFRWGEKTWPPREFNARDSGVLVHMVGEDKVWPKSIEAQMIEGGTGDIIVIEGAALTVDGETKTSGRFDRPGRNPWEDVKNFRGPFEIERPHGEWNTLEVTCAGGRLSIKVNAIETLKGQRADPNRGRILVQSEGAEVFFRRLDLYPLGD